MDYADAQRLYDRIVCGYKLVEDRGIIYKCRDPLPFHRQLTELHLEAMDTDQLMSADAGKILLKQRKLWSESDEKRLTGLIKEKDEVVSELSQSEFKSNTKQKLTNKLKELNHRIFRMARSRDALRAGNRDHVMMMMRLRYFTFLLTYTLDDRKVWETECEFDLAEDRLIKKLIAATYLDPDVHETNIRYLARNEPWRSVWIAAVKTGRLFPDSCTEMTEYQRALVAWSVIYDNAYESMEPPTDEVVDNDDLFDNWLKVQSEKRKSKQAKHNADHNISGRIGKHSDVGVVVESPTDAEKVYNLNDQQTKQKIASRQRTIQEKGMVSEINLPDVRKDLQMKANQKFGEKLKGMS